jgi:DNA polymerase III epsilon subunit-like protein
MKFAVIDTETNGLFDFTKPADAEGQPRMAALAIILLDEGMGVIGEFDYLVSPDGWEMSAEAGAVNGLTTDHLVRNGKPVIEPVNHYAKLIDEGYTIAAYGARFDTKVLRAELRRSGFADKFENTKSFCIMQALTGICKVPKKNGGGYKFPKLSEACAHFKIDQPSAHTAMGDARSAVALLQWLQKLKLIPTDLPATQT